MSNKTCPSYLAVPNSFEIGIINKAGKTQFHEAPRRLSESDLDNISTQELPIEHQIRTAGLCMKGACHQWSDDHKSCSLASNINIMDLFAHYEDYANCPIQSTCRWIAEHGENICPKCVNIIRYQNL